MNGSKAKLEADRLWHLLETEFLVCESEREKRKITEALDALEIYEDVEDFLEQTGWGRDNPELQSEEYLINNRICRWIDGKFVYFSRLVWESE